MTHGALIYALGASEIDYLKLATWQAHRIQRFLQIPVSVVTDQHCEDPVWDHVISVTQTDCDTKRWFTDIKKTVPWNNANRCDAWNLSPYDRTLLIDADYVIASTDLCAILHSDQHLTCFGKSHDITTGQRLQDLDIFGAHRLPMSWCTVLCFTKNQQTKLLFDCWRMVRDNWQHYRDLYGITDRLFRNDYALSIALIIVNGHMAMPRHFPGSLCTALPHTALNPTDHADCFRLSYRDQRDRPRYQIITGQDFHAMGKSHLQTLIDGHA